MCDLRPGCLKGESWPASPVWSRVGPQGVLPGVSRLVVQLGAHLVTQVRDLSQSYDHSPETETETLSSSVCSPSWHWAGPLPPWADPGRQSMWLAAGAVRAGLLLPPG